MNLKHQHRKFPCSKTRLDFLEENFPEVNHERKAARKGIDFILGEVQGYTLKIYEQRDMAKKCLREGDLEAAIFWLNKIGAVE